MSWLLEKSVLDAISSAEAAAFQPTASQISAFSALNGDITTTEGKVATIRIMGVLTPHRDMLAMIFGGGNATYSDIVSAVKAADDDSLVDTIELVVDSPGGRIDGLFEAMDAIKDTKTYVRAVVVNKATSAAYGLVAQANEIVALNRASSFGSIGVVTEGRIKNDTVTITSTNAPFKRPDISTETGRAIVRAELDEVEDLFVQAIAYGRDVQASTIIADFGKGSTFLAEEAMRRGMVDRIGLEKSLTDVINDSTETQSAITKTPNPKAKTMNLSELKAEHPALYDQVFALGKSEATEAVDSNERKRVAAHLKMGKKFNAMDIAIKACTEGTDVSDPEALADYMCAMADSRDLADAQADSDDTAGAEANIEAAADSEDNQDDKDAEAGANILQFAAEALGHDFPVEA